MRKKPNAKAKGGRPTDCDPKVAAQIGDLMRQGVSFTTACDVVGAPNQRVYEWRRKGEADDATEPYRTFAGILKKGRADAIAAAEKRVFAGQGQWQSSARWLESMAPDTWRRTERREVDVSGTLEIPWPDLAQPGIEGARAAARRSSRPVPEGRKDAA